MEEKNTNKQTDKIWQFIKKRVGSVTAIGTVAVFIFSALTRFLYYIINASSLSQWGIDSSFMPETDYSQLYLIAIVVISLVCNYITNYLILSVSEKAIEIVSRIELLKCRLLLLKKFRLDNYEREIKEVKDIKKELGKLEISLSLKLLCRIILISILYSICVFIMLIPLNNTIGKAIKLCLDLTLLFILFSLAPLLAQFVICRRDIRKTLLKEGVEDYEQLYKKLNVFCDRYKAEKSGRERLLSDKTIIRNIKTFLVAYLVCLVVIPLTIRTQKINTFTVTTINDTMYSVIFAGNEEVILKKCIISNNVLEIDDDSFVIMKKEELRFESHVFDRVEVKNIE